MAGGGDGGGGGGVMIIITRESITLVVPPPPAALGNSGHIFTGPGSEHQPGHQQHQPPPVVATRASLF